MFRLILGKSGYGKTEYVRRFLCDLAEKEEKLILVVPDQFTFESERAILRMAGEKLGSRIRVYSFRRLADEVMQIYGGGACDRIDDGGKILMMNLAVEACSDNLNVYLGSKDKITSMMLQTVSEFKAACVTPEMVLEKSRMSPGGLGDKLYEIGLIYSAYESLIKGSYTDPSDVITIAAEKLRESDYFKDAVVVFDSFESFNRQKREIIEAAMCRAKDVYVSLCTDSVHLVESSVFVPVSKTAMHLKALAAENNIEMQSPKILSEPKRFKNFELEHLEKNLFMPNIVPYEEEPEYINIYESRSVYGELEYAAATIRKLVMEEGLHYGDFSVICRNPHKYSSSLMNIFEKWNVPIYYSQSEKVDSSPIIRLVLSMFSIAVSGFRTEEILNMLKTGLYPVTNEEISKLENYVYLWKIDGRAWKSSFSKHPDGFGGEFDEKAKETLKEINDIRSRIVDPIIRFAERSVNTNGGEISKNIYLFLEETGVPERISENSEFFRKWGQGDRADDLIRVWKKLMDVLDQFNLALGSKEISMEKYYHYMRNVLAVESTRDIPMHLDSVLFGSADAVMQASPKVTFIMGAVQGEFPYIPSQSGLLTDGDRSRLRDMELPLENNMMDITLLEKFNAYKAAVGASERLYVSYHLSYGSEDLSPSELVEGIKQIFPLLKVKKNLPDEYFISTNESAFSAFAKHYAEDDVLKVSLDKYFAGCAEDYSGRIQALKRAADNRDFKLYDSRISSEMFSSKYISASQIETYHQCRFEYFCKYGLNARERKPAEINVMEYGTLMHYIFENIISSDFMKYKDVPEQLPDDIRVLIRRYADENMGGFDNLSPRDLYRFKRMTETAETLILHMVDEFSESSFRPKYFELKLSDDGEFPPLKIMTPSGAVVKVGGVIDRVDIYDSPEGKYVRIVDYKTGKKEFKLFDVLYGLNLQMLIYLAALKESGKFIPAGILYMPSSMPVVSADRNNTQDDIKKEKLKKMKMNGMVLNDAEIIHAMEASAQGKYIPVSISDKGRMKGEENALTSQEMDKVFTFIKKLVSTMADELIHGNIQAQPQMLNRNSCAWCPYGPVCLAQKDDSFVCSDRARKELVLEMMTEGDEDDA